MAGIAVKRSRSRWEATLELQLRTVGLHPDVERTFFPGRRFRFDFAFVVEKVAAEVEGGIYTRGRHTRGAGYESDCEKYNLAAMAGWLVLRFTPSMVQSGEACRMVQDALKLRRAA